MADDGDKTLDPTPHRRQQAREKGQFARSHDLNAAGLLVGGLAALLLAGGRVLEFLASLMTDHLSGSAWLSDLPASAADPSAALVDRWTTLVPSLATAVLPLLALALAASVAVQLVQSGLRLRPQGAAPDFARINPLAGLARLASGGNLARVAFGPLKLATIVGVAVWCLYGRVGELASISDLSVGEIARYVWETCLWTCVKIAAALAGLAVLDYALARWKFERDLKMTPAELRDEMRNLQGDPQVIARRRTFGRQLAEGRAVEAVRHADLVVSQPGRTAVALRYDPATMAAPIVVARGKNATAEQIDKLAAEHGIAIAELGPLARRLYRETAVNTAIPAPFYGVVAEAMSQSSSKPRQFAA